MRAASAASTNFSRSSNSFASGRSPCSTWSNNPICIMHSAPYPFHTRRFGDQISGCWRQTDPSSHADAIGIGLQPRGVDAVDGKLFVAVLGIAGYTEGANDFAARIADQHAPAFGKDLIAARGNEIAHEDRPLLRPLANEFRAAAER